MHTRASHLQNLDQPATTLMLASASKARKVVLQAAGISPLIYPSTVDEANILQELKQSDRDSPNPGPAKQVASLATAKAKDVLEKILNDSSPLTDNPRLLIVGCDSMLEHNGEMLGKPYNPKNAMSRIKELRGKNPILWTGHHLILLEKESFLNSDSSKSSDKWRVVDSVTKSEATTVHFGQMNDDEIAAYVATGEPLYVAGSFTIDGLGGPFLRGVTGDPHSVIGISLPLLRNMANSLGVFWPTLWNSGDTKWELIRERMTEENE